MRCNPHKKNRPLGRFFSFRAGAEKGLFCYTGAMWMRSTTFLFFAVALCLLAVVHVLAITFFLYWTYSWLDIPMHALGGVVVALGFLTFFTLYRRIAFLKGLTITLAVVLMVGVTWEVFEFMNGIERSGAGYGADTILDFVMDIVGGCLGYAAAFVGAKFNPEPS